MQEPLLAVSPPSSDEQSDVPRILPDDEDNRRLLKHVHPADWVNPRPNGRYNIVVIGAGPAGLIVAVVAASVGAKVALIEKHLMGGDCLNVGCVPSKSIIRAARVWADIRNAAEFGVHVSDQGTTYDFAAVMARMRKLRARLSVVDSAQRYKELGVDVFIGEGRFAGPETIQVRGETLKFRRAAICTGARAAPPPIPGLSDAGCLTNETVFELTSLPKRLAVIGAGPIGCELSQAFARFASQVSLIEQMSRILPREDADAAGVVHDQLKKDGVTVIPGATVTQVERRGRERVVHYVKEGKAGQILVDEILIGTGRAPNVEGLGLDRAGIAFDVRKGVTVNARLQTTNPRVYAAGDICSPFQFTHTADAMAQIVIQNALFPHPLGLGYASIDSLIVPWCTYTEPEIAHVGMYPADAEAKGIKTETYTFQLDEVDRAILDGQEHGFARVHVQKGSDKILGATIVAAHAGEMISELSVVMKGGLGLSAITGTIHPYPTQAEVIKKVANAWRKTTFTEGKKRFLSKLFAWMRR
jgi:pyruvate/2-oxoglutarate dehydrogenase complex dihydrolipoamide dehydrogenase (E3) component